MSIFLCEVLYYSPLRSLAFSFWFRQNDRLITADKASNFMVYLWAWKGRMSKCTTLPLNRKSKLTASTSITYIISQATRRDLRCEYQDPDFPVWSLLNTRALKITKSEEFCTMISIKRCKLNTDLPEPYPPRTLPGKKGCMNCAPFLTTSKRTNALPYFQNW